MRILIVDQHEDARDQVAQTLAARGHETIAADDGRAALERLAEGRVDLVVSDVVLPRMDGFSLCYEMKRTPAFSRIPFVFYASGDDEHKDEQIGLKVGAARFVDRRAPPVELADVVTEVMRERSEGGRRARAELADVSGLVAYDYDIPTGRIDWRGDILRLTGFAPDEFASVGIDRWAAMIHPDDREQALASLDEAMGHMGAYNVEYRFERKDGTYVHVEDHGVFLTDAGGKAFRMVGTMGDITARKRAEETQRRTEEKYRAIIENAVEGIFQVTPAGTFLEANPAMAKILGYDIGWRLTDGGSDLGSRIWVDPERQAAYLHALRVYGVARSFEAEWRRADGKNVWVSLNARAVRGREGELELIEGTAEDISERKQAEAARARLEQELRQAQKMEALGTLAGGIAHDFNNILTAILGYGEMLRLELPADGDLHDAVLAILDACGRARDLVKHILTFSRRSEPQRVPTELGRVIEEALKLLRASLPATIEIEREVAKDPAPVLADPTQILQVVMNLATNAAHAMRDEGGTLGVGLVPLTVDAAFAREHPPLHEGRYVRIRVRDTGVGIDPATIDRIFEPFFTTKDPGEGTGLGLSVVHGIVQAHDGVILVRSTPGHGSVFDVYLPVVQTETEESADARTTLPMGRGERVLLVDDEVAIVALADRMLKRLGYEPHGFVRPEDALEAFRSNPRGFDLLMTDLTMPRLVGTGLAAECLRIRPDLPVVVATGHPATLDDALVRTIGIRGVLAKPFTLRGMGEALARALAAPVAQEAATTS